MTTDSVGTATKWSRYAPFTGAIFVVLWLVGNLLMAQFEFLPDADKAISTLKDDSTTIRIGGYLVGLSAFFLIWFSSSLRDYLTRLDGDNGRLANVAFGGGLIAASFMLLGSVVYSVAAERAASDSGIGGDYATLATDINGALIGSAVAFAIGTSIYATAVVWFRSGAVKKWLAVIAGVAGIALISPVNWAVVVILIPAFLLLSILAYRQQSATDSA